MARIKEYMLENVQYIIPISFYALLSVVYLFLLYMLNAELKALIAGEDGMSLYTAFKVISYKNNLPLLFVLLSVTFVAGGPYLIYWYWRKERYSGYYLSDVDDEYRLLIMKLVSTIVIIVFMFLHIHAITIPIFRALLITVVAGGLGMMALSSK